ncbi:UNVERIFIED_CONTAM: hypothetical protein BEN50_08955, partial [Euhalothece sp. KZN 001]
IFRDCLNSQKEYDFKHNYHYQALTESPPSGISGTMSGWLKIVTICRLLRKGYQKVFFIDADALVRDYAPPIETILEEKKDIYVSYDFSNRINSGVILVRNSKASQSFFRKLHWMSDIPGGFLPKEDRNLYENGHFIFLAKKEPSVKIISNKWNNTTGESIGEYIWHGRGMYQKKSRSKTKPKSPTNSFLERIIKGPRYIELLRLVNFYERKHNF